MDVLALAGWVSAKATNKRRLYSHSTITDGSMDVPRCAAKVHDQLVARKNIDPKVALELAAVWEQAPWFFKYTCNTCNVEATCTQESPTMIHQCKMWKHGKARRGNVVPRW